MGDFVMSGTIDHVITPAGKDVSAVPMTKQAWAEVPSEERRRRALKGRRSSAVKIVAEHWPELPEEDQDRLLDAMFPSGDRR
jgi:hypothetical protein